MPHQSKLGVSQVLCSLNDENIIQQKQFSKYRYQTYLPTICMEKAILNHLPKLQKAQAMTLYQSFLIDMTFKVPCICSSWLWYSRGVPAIIQIYIFSTLTLCISMESQMSREEKNSIKNGEKSI